MIYLKKVISQDIERTPTFSNAAIEGYFCLNLDNGEDVTRKIILKPSDEEFDIKFQLRKTRNEYRVFLNELFDRIEPDIGDILILTKIDANTYECQHIVPFDTEYEEISKCFNGTENHQFLPHL